MLIAELQIAITTNQRCSLIACLKIEYFAKKPGSGGMPDNDSKQTVSINAIKGERLPKPLNIAKLFVLLCSGLISITQAKMPIVAME